MKITQRLFKTSDAQVVVDLIARTMRVSNRKDYSAAYIERDIHERDAAFFVAQAKQTHFYVFFDGAKIIATGAIGSYWGSQTEFSLFSIFVDPQYQGQGVGRFVIQTLEQDPYFLKAKRVEIPASITGLPFYQKMGYQFKDGVDQVDEEQLYRLEKFTKSN
ncbi:GNAT family N-acetyltransferase [Pediococcus siamensis]|uniref:GNAT family N-acetyltransferase n=1 Tax=Pediococcus siamensis TaxID=381829 RepID=UPI0039A1CAE3